MLPAGMKTVGRCCWPEAADTASSRIAASAATRVPWDACMALPHEGELRQADRIVSRPGPDERLVAGRRVRAHAHVVLGVGLEGDAAEERQPREVAGQPA